MRHSAPLLCVFFLALLLTSTAAHAHVLTTGFWSTHAQSPTIRADRLIEEQGHFMWTISPVPARNIAVVVLDGYLEDGTRFSRAPGIFYRDVENMARQFIRDMFISSHGHVRYEAIDLIVTSNTPMRRLGPAEGNVYTNFSLDAFYDRCVENPNHGPLTVDNDGSTMDAHCIRETLKNITMTTGISLFDAATNGVVHEILIFGPHKTFQWETSMCGAHPLWINGVSAVIPGSPHFVILGANSNRGVAEMLHNNYHRWENVAPDMYAHAKHIGWRYQWSYAWHGATPPYPYTELERQTLFLEKYNAWEQYSALYYSLHTNINTVGQTLAGIGDCHYPANVLPKVDGAYTYGAMRDGYSTYDYWRQPLLQLNHNNAPDPRFGESRPVNAMTWRNEVAWQPGVVDYQRSFIVWSYIAMPHGPGLHKNITAQEVSGETPNYILNNWWCYFADHEGFLEPIRALRRAGQITNHFPEPEWAHSTVTFMTNTWQGMGLPTVFHTVTLTTEGDGSVHGAGTFPWGSSTLLTSTPPAYAWIYSGHTNYAVNWQSVLVTNDLAVHVVFHTYPSITITHPTDAHVRVPSTTDHFPFSGTTSDADAAWWENLATGAHGTLSPGDWQVDAPLTNGINTFIFSASNQWFTVSNRVDITRTTPIHVAPWGNNANDGFSWDTPKLTVAGALVICNEGDTILVGPGSYSGAGNVNLDWGMHNGVNLIGDSPTGTVFVLSGDERLVTGLENKSKPTLFANFKVDGSAKNDGFTGTASLFTVGSSSALNLIFSNLWMVGRYDGDQVAGVPGTADQANGTAIELGWWGAQTAYSGTVAITHCLIEGFGRAFYCNDDFGVSCYTVRVVRSTFVNNADTRSWPASDISTIWLRGNNTGRWMIFDHCVMSHCAGDNTTSAKSGIFCQPDATRILHDNNLFYLNSIGVGAARLYGSTLARHVGYQSNDETTEPAYETHSGMPYALPRIPGEPVRGWYIVPGTNAPIIADDALLFPAAYESVMHKQPTYIEWDPLRITDEIDGTNSWIVQWDVLRSNSLAYVQSITTPVRNGIGKVPWTPAPVGGDHPQMYFVQIVAQNSDGNMSSNIMWDAPFYIIPEPSLWMVFCSSVLLILHWRRT